MPTITSKKVQGTYLFLMLTNTLAASFIWGINTLFLLDAGLNNTEAFAANAFFTLGMVLFEVPTGIVADAQGRKLSYVLGAATLVVSTGIYLYAWYVKAPFIIWIISSLILGLGFTFFSGATEAWLVDALKYTKFKGQLESVFAKGQIVSGIAMLTGSVAGGYISQITNLGVPYIIRIGILIINLFVAFFFMKDFGFKPTTSGNAFKDMKRIFNESIKHGFKNPPVRWVMLSSVFTAGIGIYAFYAMQPYLLELYGNPQAYGIAGIAAAVVAGAQILGGLTATHLSKLFRRRTSILLAAVILNVGLLVLIGLISNFTIAIILMTVWGLVFSTSMPIRQTYLNKLIPSEQRATVLSFDSLVGSSGGIFSQPALGKVADVYNYSTSFVVSGIIQMLSIPFLVLAKKTATKADQITQ